MIIQGQCLRDAHGLKPNLSCHVRQCGLCYLYQVGDNPPNYPVPATMHNARIAQYPQWIADCLYWQDIGWADNA